MFSVASRFMSHTKLDSFRQFSKKVSTANINQIDQLVIPSKKCIGQPTSETHPHLLKKGEVTPLLTQNEFQNRRDRLMGLIFNNSKPDTKHLLIVPAASKKYMSNKIPYVFRQNTEFLYLSGCQEPDCCIVISSTNAPGQHCTTLFTRNKDEHSELWDGPRTYPEDAPEFFGVDQSLPISELENFINSYKKTHNKVHVWYDFLKPVQSNVHKILTDYIKSCQNKSAESPKPYIDRLRLFKSPAEVALMQKSCDIASEGFVKTIESSRIGISENELFAKVDYECRLRGAEFLAYPPVVAGGNRATTIHYINNNQVVHDNETVLMDAGCEYHGYSSDITRTWPINGKFSSNQKIVYEIVLSVQEELINFLHTFPTLDTLFENMCYLLGKQLQKTGLVGVQPSDQYLMRVAYGLCPHHVSHYLGMDVHDTPSIPRNIKLQPGMIITVEPGIYVNHKNKDVPKDFQGIGVRIEDDVLITENGPVVLSRNCPKQIDEIERIASGLK